MAMHHHFYKLILLLAATITTYNVQAQVIINEYSASNLSSFADNFNKYEDWIEVHNSGLNAVDISGFGLSDKIDNPFKWNFPEGTTLEAGGFIRVWASGRNSLSSPNHLHTNFKLTQTKDNPEIIVLSTLSGISSDLVELTITQKGHSRGRITNGGLEWGVFTNPTPGSSNNSASSYERYAAKPEVSNPAGFYEGGVFVSLSTEEPFSQIRYTLDGADPTASSSLYSSPLSITTTSVLKAITISSNNNILPSFFEFDTYFIDEDHTMAIMSVAAADLDNLLNGNQSLTPLGTFEYFNKTHERTTIGYGEFNEHGQDSWVHPQRSIDYISRDECGYNYAIREQLIPLTDRDEFQRIILRAAGDDNYPGIDTSALLRDFFVQNTAEKANLHLDVRKGEKGVMYVNGQFWGIYGFREKVSDHDFTEYYYNQDKYNIYFLMLWGGSWAEYGGQPAWDDWNELHNFIKTQDLTEAENWEYVKARYDYKSLVDYIHINSYVVCSDWINWNVGWWRGINPDGDHQKWGYILWDEDATFAHYINYTGVPGISPYTSPCFPQGLSSDPEEHIVALNHLRDNPEFDQYYISRYIDLYNTVFKPERMIGYLDSIEDVMEPEFSQHVERWGGSVQQWKGNVQKIRNFITNRHAYLPGGLSSCWNLTGPYDFTVEAEPSGAGGVQLNSLEVMQFPFNGDYFGGIDIKLEALETNPIYEFDYWELNNHTVFPNSTTRNVILQLSQSDVLVAHFKERLYSDSLVINEINYNSAADFNTEDWIEFYNPHLYDLNIAGWEFKDEDDNHSFIFPENTIIEAYGYLVLCRDTSLFTGLFPNVDNYLGNMDFGFSGSDELLRLYNDEGVLIDTVNYMDDDPWPSEPDGNGPTLELILPQYDNALATSWMASPDHGTPGEINSYWVSIAEQSTLTKKVTLTVVPNPLTSTAMIHIDSPVELINGQLTLYNVFGDEVRKFENIKSDKIEIYKNGLPEGLYIIRYTDSRERTQGSGKLIIK